MKEARSSGIKELHSFVAGIERDLVDQIKAAREPKKRNQLGGKRDEGRG